MKPQQLFKTCWDDEPLTMNEMHLCCKWWSDGFDEGVAYEKARAKGKVKLVKTK